MRDQRLAYSCGREQGAESLLPTGTVVQVKRVTRNPRTVLASGDPLGTL